MAKFIYAIAKVCTLGEVKSPATYMVATISPAFLALIGHAKDVIEKHGFSMIEMDMCRIDNEANVPEYVFINDIEWLPEPARAYLEIHNSIIIQGHQLELVDLSFGYSDDDYCVNGQFIEFYGNTFKIVERMGDMANQVYASFTARFNTIHDF